MEANLLRWAASGADHLVLAAALSAAEGPPGDDRTAQIIVALIGALALILVALIPALVNRQQKRDATTTPSPPTPTGPSPDEVARIWTAIEGLRDAQQRSFREHAGYEALLDECRRDGEHLASELARERDARISDVGSLRDDLTKHVYGSGHPDPRS